MRASLAIVAVVAALALRAVSKARRVRPGRQGDAGPQGPQGVKGETGPIGPAGAARRPWLERPARAAPARLRPEQQLRSHLQPGRETDLGDLPRRHHRHHQERRHRSRHLLKRDRTGLGAVHEAVNSPPSPRVRGEGWGEGAYPLGSESRRGPSPSFTSLSRPLPRGGERLS